MNTLTTQIGSRDTKSNRQTVSFPTLGGPPALCFRLPLFSGGIMKRKWYLNECYDCRHMWSSEKEADYCPRCDSDICLSSEEEETIEDVEWKELL